MKDNLDSMMVNSSSSLSFQNPFILDDNKDDSNLAFGSSSVSFKQGRQLLRQYEQQYFFSLIFISLLDI